MYVDSVKKYWHFLIKFLFYALFFLEFCHIGHVGCSFEKSNSFVPRSEFELEKLIASFYLFDYENQYCETVFKPPIFAFVNF